MGFFTKDIKTMDDLLIHGLQDIYYAGTWSAATIQCKYYYCRLPIFIECAFIIRCRKIIFVQHKSRIYCS